MNIETLLHCSWNFAKSYDTLDRDHLFAVLRKHGYPDHLVTVTEKIHTGLPGDFWQMGSDRDKYLLPGEYVKDARSLHFYSF